MKESPHKAFLHLQDLDGEYMSSNRVHDYFVVRDGFIADFSCLEVENHQCIFVEELTAQVVLSGTVRHV